MDRAGVEVIAGVNLPMLVKLAKVRSVQPLAEVVDCAQTAGRKYIAAASHVLPVARSLAEKILCEKLGEQLGAKLAGNCG
jgi:mannose/fructose-specific phosphotransferase system component IIA